MAPAVVVLVSAQAAHAEHDSQWAQRPFAVAAHLGAGTPVGFAGLTADYTLLPRLSPSVGFGVGSGRTGGSLHLAAGSMFRFYERRESALYLSIDYSTGGWGESITFATPASSGLQDNNKFSDRMHWLHASLGADIRRTNGFVLRAYMGLGTMLNPGSRRCIDEVTGRPCLSSDIDYGTTEIAFLGVALGFAE